MIYTICYILAFLPLALILPIKVVGKKNIEKKKNYIFVFNHQSNFDGVILNYKLKRKIHYLAKKELWKNKEKSFFLDKVLGCIKVDRQKGLNLTTTKQIFSTLAQGNSIGIAPEGTRNSVEIDQNTDIKNGVCLFAIKSKTPIVPCFIQKKQKAFRKNVLIIGKPFELCEFYGKKLDKDELYKAGKELWSKINDLKTNFENYERERQIVRNLKKTKM